MIQLKKIRQRNGLIVIRNKLFNPTIYKRGRVEFFYCFEEIVAREKNVDGPGRASLPGR